MKRMIFLPMLLATTLLAMAQAQSPKGDVASQCDSCHAAGSKGETGQIPRLNGQRFEYLMRRMDELTIAQIQSPRSIDAMWSNAHKLNDATRRQVATYFSQQSPTGASSKVSSASGKTLFETGIASANVPACQSCHGSSGEGSAAAPRLAGQKKEYLTDQLWAFNLVTRVHGPMNNTAMRLESDQIDVLSAYLSLR